MKLFLNRDSLQWAFILPCGYHIWGTYTTEVTLGEGGNGFACHRGVKRKQKMAQCFSVRVCKHHFNPLNPTTCQQVWKTCFLLKINNIKPFIRARNCKNWKHCWILKFQVFREGTVAGKVTKSKLKIVIFNQNHFVLLFSFKKMTKINSLHYQIL